MIYSKPLANFPFPAHPIFDEAVEFLPQILITTLVTFVTTPNDLSCLTITIVSHKRSSFCYSERVFRKKKKKDCRNSDKLAVQTADTMSTFVGYLHKRFVFDA